MTNLRQVIDLCRRRIYLAVALIQMGQCVASRNRWEYDWAVNQLGGCDGEDAWRKESDAERVAG